MNLEVQTSSGSWNGVPSRFLSNAIRCPAVELLFKPTNRLRCLTSRISAGMHFHSAENRSWNKRHSLAVLSIEPADPTQAHLPRASGCSKKSTMLYVSCTPRRLEQIRDRPTAPITLHWRSHGVVRVSNSARADCQYEHGELCCDRVPVRTLFLNSATLPL